uniref:PWWP domain-containing protein n=1 Tax=Theropithecus gelada TaxID=9565 RepID=A0A8D2FFV5_THEGE
MGAVSSLFSNLMWGKLGWYPPSPGKIVKSPKDLKKPHGTREPHGKKCFFVKFFWNIRSCLD